MTKRSRLLVIFLLLLSICLPTPTLAAGTPPPTWESVRGPGRLSGVAYGNGLYVASESGRAEVLLSSDGINWTAQPIDAEAKLGLLLWAGDQFVGITRDAVWTSPDGKAWTKRFTSPYPSVNSLSYANGHLFVTNQAAGFWSSADGGRSWTKISGRLMTSIVYQGDRYIGVHYAAPGIWTSKDGLTWQMLSETADLQPNDILQGAGRAIVLGHLGPKIELLATTDAQSWSKSELSQYYLGSGTFYKGAFYLVVNAKLLRSVDGQNWTELPLVRPDSRSGSALVLLPAGENLYLIGEGLWYRQTTDGSWTYVLPDRLQGGWNSVAWGAGHWVATGYNGQLFTATDGRAWQRIDVGITRALVHVQWVGDRFFAFSDNTVVGSCREPGPNETCRSWVLQSKDGVTWSKSEIDAPQILSVAMVGGTLLAVDWGWNLWRSTDGGLSWVKQPHYGELLWDSVDAHDGYFWAIAEQDVVKTMHIQSYLLRSKDGLTWESAYTFASGEGLSSLSWTDGGLLVWGDSLRIFRSTDLKSWEQTGLFTNDYSGSLLRSVAYAEGQMVGAQTLSRGDALIQFKQGGSAPDHLMTFNGSVHSVAYHDGEFLAVGGGGSVYSLRIRPATATCGTRFADLPASLIGCEAVESLAATGVVGGFPDGTFHPTAGVSRAEIAKLLVLAKQWRPDPTGALAFADTAGHWATVGGFLQAAVQHKALAGFPDGSFQPEGTLTRAQLIKVVVAAAGLTPGGAPSYGDIAKSDWSRGWVAAAEGAKLIGKGAPIPLWTSTSLDAERPATRLEAAIILDNLLQLPTTK